MSAALLERIDAFLVETDMPPCVFGIHAVRDPRFVGDLRFGRIPRPETVERVTAYMEGRSPSYHSEPQKAPKLPAPKAVRRERRAPTNLVTAPSPSPVKVASAPKPRPRGKSTQALDLLPRIEQACAARNMLPSRFGRRAVNDAALVNRIRSGRGLRSATREKVEAYLGKLEWMAALSV